MLVTKDIVREDPRVDWSRQTQHLFRDNLRAAAARLFVVSQSAESRVMDYGTFLQRRTELENDEAFHLLLSLFTGCKASLLENPVFWIRVVGYGHVCAQLLNAQGPTFGFEPQVYSLPTLLSGLSDGGSQSSVSDNVLWIEEAGRRGL
jgi:hypothetical protein